MSYPADQAQRAIIESESPAIKLVAGPGTGKTMTMEGRVSKLLEDGIDARNILCCTFTKNAATDLKNKLSNINPTTIHAHCFKILNGENDFLTTKNRSLRIIVFDFEKKVLLHDLKRCTNLDYYENERKLKAFEAGWARGEKDEPGWPDSEEDQDFNKHLNNWLSFHHAILIGELVPLTYEFLKANPANAYRRKYKYIIVDEYQDLNKVDQGIIKLFINNDTKLMVIGDADQSIYSFRYAHPEGMNNFEKNYSSYYTKDEIIKPSLKICYRCPKLIVKLANNLIAENTDRPDEYNLLRYDENSDGLIHIVQWDTEGEELQGISNYIKKITAKEENSQKKIFLLVPTNPYGNKIYEQLKRIEIDSNNLCNKKRNHEKEKAVTLLHLLNDREDRVSLRIWCSFNHQDGDNNYEPSYNCKEWNSLTQKCKSASISPWQAISDRMHGITIPAKIVRHFTKLELELNNLEELAGISLIDALFPDDEEWARSVRKNCLRINGENNNNVDKKILLRGLQDMEKENISIIPGEINIMTLHKSKGLTADIVVIIGCAEGLIPNFNSENPIDEKRRLFYVGLTRTTETLILSSPHEISIEMQKTNNIDISRCSMSRFISEANKENIITPIRGEKFKQLYEF